MLFTALEDSCFLYISVETSAVENYENSGAQHKNNEVTKKLCSDYLFFFFLI